MKRIGFAIAGLGMVFCFVAMVINLPLTFLTVLIPFIFIGLGFYLSER